MGPSSEAHQTYGWLIHRRGVSQDSWPKACLGTPTRLGVTHLQLQSPPTLAQIPPGLKEPVHPSGCSGHSSGHSVTHLDWSGSSFPDESLGLPRSHKRGFDLSASESLGKEWGQRPLGRCVRRALVSPPRPAPPPPLGSGTSTELCRAGLRQRRRRWRRELTEGRAGKAWGGRVLGSNLPRPRGQEAGAGILGECFYRAG